MIFLPDFRNPRRTGLFWPWCVFALGVIGLGVASVLGLAERHRIEDMQRELAQQRAAAQLVAPRTTPAAAQKPRPSVALADRQARDEGIRLVRMLQVDWPRRLTQVEKASQTVAAKSGPGALNLTALRLDSATQQIDLRGDVAQLADLDRLRLAWIAEGIALVQINRHEAIERDGKRRHEFQAVLGWDRKDGS
jgi:hypothetical protein